jgi:hypothetical protein
VRAEVKRIDPLVAAIAAALTAADAWEKADDATRCGECGARVRTPHAIKLAAAVADWRSAMDAKRAKDKFEAEAPTSKKARPIK